MQVKKKIVIIGTGSAIAEHCACEWSFGTEVDLTLVGRDSVRTEQLAADLRARSPDSDIRVMMADFTGPAVIQAFVDVIVAKGAVDLVLIGQESLPDQVCQGDLKLVRDALDINGITPVLYAEAFASHMARMNRGTLALVGSAAGDGEGKSGYVYGAALGMVTHYAQGLQHRFAGTGVKIVLINPAAAGQPMIARMKALELGARLAPVAGIAHKIAGAILPGTPTAYAPGKWRGLTWTIQHLPSFIFKKINI